MLSIPAEETIIKYFKLSFLQQFVLFFFSILHIIYLSIVLFLWQTIKEYTNKKKRKKLRKLSN